MQETLEQKIARLERAILKGGGPGLKSESPATKKIGGTTARPGSVRSGYGVDANKLPRIDKLVDKLANAIEFGVDSRFFGVPGIAVDAIEAALRPDYSFEDMRNLRQERIQSLPTTVQIGASVVGGRGGSAPSVAKAIPQFGKWAAAQGSKLGWEGVRNRALAGLVEGAGQGVASGVGENVGSTSGVINPALMGLGFGAGLGTAAPALMGGLRWAGESTGVLKPGMSDAKRLAVEALEIATGKTPSKPVTPRDRFDAPSRDVDILGDDALALARGSGRTIAGRAAGRIEYGDEAGQELPNMRAVVKQTTGVGEEEARRINLDRTNLKEAREAAEPTMTSGLNALERTTGRTPDIRGELDRLEQLRLGDEGPVKAAYKAAEAASARNGAVIPPEWSEFLKQREGAAAFLRAIERREAEGLLAFKEKRPHNPLPYETIGGKKVTLPDAQAWFEMRQELAHLADLNPSAPAPKLSPAAIAINRDLHNVAEANQSFEYNAANDILKQIIGDEDAYKTGLREISGLPVPDKMLTASLDAVEEGRRRVALIGDPVAKQQALQRVAMTEKAMQFFIAQQMKTGQSVKEMLEKLKDPRSDISRQFALAGIPESFAASQRGYEMVPRELQRNLGLGIFEADVGSFPSVRKEMAKSPTARRVVQESVGAAAQDRLTGGNRLDLDVPGREEAFGLGTRTPEGLGTAKATERSWSAAKTLRESIIGGEGKITPPDAGSRMDKIFRAATPSVTWTASRLAHAMAESGKIEGTESMAKEIMRLVLSEPGSTAKAIAELQAIRGKYAATAQRAAGLLGRASGTAGSSANDPLRP